MLLNEDNGILQTSVLLGHSSFVPKEMKAALPNNWLRVSVDSQPATSVNIDHIKSQ